MSIDKILAQIDIAPWAMTNTAKNTISIAESFATMMISELLRSSDVFSEDEGLNYAGMFRWQMARFLSQSVAKNLGIDFENKGNLESLAEKVSQDFEVDPKLVKAIIDVESGWDSSAVSLKDAKGLMQLADSTAERFDVQNAFDPAQNIEGGVKFLKHLLNKFKDIKLVLAAYNAGEGAVEKYSGVPPFKETRDYIQKVLGRLE